MNNGWIGVDLDGTLAYYTHFKTAGTIGEPIMPMVERIKIWLARGYEVKIFTARMSVPHEVEEVKKAVFDWTLQHIGIGLEATCIKDFRMIELWDDRCVQVIPNTGIPLVENNIRF